jgi:hypothetical protein
METSLTGREIRPIEPGDKASLTAAANQSSDEAIYRRFGTRREYPQFFGRGCDGRFNCRKTALQSQIQHRGNDRTQATRRLDIPAT